MAISKINSKALVDCSVAAVDIEDGSITSAKLAGSIANAKLANSSITVNGNTVSLGASGSIPPVQWQSVVTADGSTTTTAVSGNGYFIDTTSAAHTITLPASPSAGDYVAIKDYAGTFGTNNLTIGRNSENIQGVANDSLISTNRASIVLVYIDSTKGWLYTVESNVDDLGAPLFIAATGGTVTTSGDFKIHTFTGDGCFVVSSLGGGATPCAVASTVDYLVVAGGGGGGSKCGTPFPMNGGGGGAGGFRESKDSTVSSPHTASPLAATTGLTITATTYPVTVGGGGSPGVCGIGQSSGSNSIFSTITSTGGGYAGSSGPSFTPAPTRAGGPGGSGGGTSANNAGQSAGSGNTPPVSPSQGNPGGTGSPDSSNSSGAGGGGGATAAGSVGYCYTGGCGGAGATTSISGSSVAYAGGGGGAAGPGGGGVGGIGGGGNRSPGSPPATAGFPGTANTGGGGGGGGNPDANPPGGAGGKGIVIIRYKYQ